MAFVAKNQQKESSANQCEVSIALPLHRGRIPSLYVDPAGGKIRTNSSRDKMLTMSGKGVDDADVNVCVAHNSSPLQG